MSDLARVEVERSAGAVVATIEGEVDMSNARVVAEQLTGEVRPGGRGVVVDLRPLRYIDSAGLRILFLLDERLARRGQRLALVLGEGSNIERVLALTGVTAAMPVERAVEDALARLPRADGEHPPG